MNMGAYLVHGQLGFHILGKKMDARAAAGPKELLQIFFLGHHSLPFVYV